jgi:hypothetical protein
MMNGLEAPSNHTNGWYVVFVCLFMYVVDLDYACTMATISFLELILASDEYSSEFHLSIVRPIT